MSDASVAIEILLVVESDVAYERFLEAQRYAARQTRALIVVHDELAFGVRLAVEIAYAVVCVENTDVADQRRS